MSPTLASIAFLLQSGGGMVVIPQAENTWPTDTDACGLMSQEAEAVARVRPVQQRGVRIILQPVDCGSRTVTRIIEIETFRKGAEAEMPASAQRVAASFACENPRNKVMSKRGWTFRAEIRAAGSDATGTGSVTGACVNG